MTAFDPLSFKNMVTIFRGKTRTLLRKPTSVNDLPEWNYDGSSTNQSTGENSDVLLKPVSFYRLRVARMISLQPVKNTCKILAWR